MPEEQKKTAEEIKAVNALADALIDSCVGADYSVFMNACIQAMVKVTIQANPTMNVVTALNYVIVAIDHIQAAESILKPNIVITGH